MGGGGGERVVSGWWWEGVVLGWRVAVGGLLRRSLGGSVGCGVLELCF